MAKIVKFIPVFSAVNATRAANTYARPTGSPRFLYTAANWSATTVTCYFEATIKTSAGTGYAALYTTGGSVVASSEVSTASTTTVRLRSAAITLTNATEYELRIKNSATNTTTIYGARIVFVLDGTISACETHIQLQPILSTTTSTTYANPSTAGWMLYTAANWDGVSGIYLEGCLSNNTAGNVAYCSLYTGGGAVSSSEISVTGTAYSRARSAAITLTDATEYDPYYKASATTARLSDARLIIIQTSPTKTEGHAMLKVTNESTTSTTEVDTLDRIYWDNDEYSVSSRTDYLEAVLYIANAASTNTTDIYDGSSSLASITSSVASRTRVRSAAITPVDNSTYYARWKTSNASHSSAVIVPRIISVVVITSGTPATTKSFSLLGVG
jgi:hypothetical protein